MMSKWMGAAAAVVMACGWASGAQAYYLSTSYDFGYTEDRNVQFQITIDNGIIDFVESYYYEPEANAYQPNFSLVDRGVATGSGYVYDINHSAGGEFTTLYFKIHQLNVVTSYDYEDFRSGDEVHRTTNQDVAFSSNITLNIFGYGPNEYDFASSGYFSDIYGRTDAFNSTPGYYDLSTIPLPASAPLFGIALLGLAAGYRARGKRAA